MLHRDNTGSRVAVQSLLRERDLGLAYTDAESLVTQLRDTARMSVLRESVWQQRGDFTFDAHVGELVSLFRSVLS